MRSLFSAFFAVLALAGLMFNSVAVCAQTVAPPSSIHFQGRLATPGGNPVPDGTYSIHLIVYNAETGGNIIYSKNFPDVQVKNGTFSIVITGISPATFNGNAWLQIKIGSDAPLTPRTQLISVPYAMKSNLALTVPDNSITSVQLAADASSLSKLTGSLIQHNANTVTIGGTPGSKRLRINARTIGDGMEISGTGSSAPSLALLSGETFRGDLGLALTAGQYSTDASPNDIVLRSAPGRLLFQNGGNAAALILENNQARFNNVLTAMGGAYFGNGSDLRLLANINNPGEPGDIVFAAFDDSQIARIYATVGNSAELVFSVSPDSAKAMSIFSDRRVSIDSGIGFTNAKLSVAATNLAYAIGAQGSMIANGYVTVSDARLKEHIEMVPDALSTILNLRGVTYDFNSKVPSSMTGQEGKQYGFLAQEVEQVLPALVHQGLDGYKAVNYQGIIPVTVEAIRAQQNQINVLKAKNTELESKLSEVLKRLEAVEKQSRGK